MDKIIARDTLASRFAHRPIGELETLLAAALDFTSPADLDAWEKSQLTQKTEAKG